MQSIGYIRVSVESSIYLQTFIEWFTHEFFVNIRRFLQKCLGVLKLQTLRVCKELLRYEAGGQSRWWR